MFWFLSSQCFDRLPWKTVGAQTIVFFTGRQLDQGHIGGSMGFC